MNKYNLTLVTALALFVFGSAYGYVGTEIDALTSALTLIK